MRVLLVVLEHDVVARLVLLDEVRFEHERLDLGVGDDEFEVAYAADEFARLRVVAAPRLEIGAHAVAEVLRLADVDDLPRLVLVQIDAGRRGQILKFLFERQSLALQLPFTMRIHRQFSARIARAEVRGGASCAVLVLGCTARHL